MYNTGDRLESVEGLNASLLSCKQVGRIYTEKIKIFATEYLNGTPIECMYGLMSNKKSAKYSMFALLNVAESQTEEG